MPLYRNFIQIGSLLATIILTVLACTSKTDNTLNLAGDWDFKIDSLDLGIKDKWFLTEFEEKIVLPGSMLTNGKGSEVSLKTNWTGGLWNTDWSISPKYERFRKDENFKISFWLQPDKHYVGSAWYKKQIKIPEFWSGQTIELFLERCHWESTIWVDSTKIGMQNSLGTPHIYYLTEYLTPGNHSITIRIDNRIKDIDPGKDAHSISDNTQTNWNGIIGKILLIRRSPVFIESAQVFPDIGQKNIRVDAVIINKSGKTTECQFSMIAIPQFDLTEKENELKVYNKKISLHADTNLVSFYYSMGNNPVLWDEFHPNIYTLNSAISGDSGTDSIKVNFGMRKFSISGLHFAINNKPIFLRGTLECAIFPKTGFPPVDENDWQRIFQICKSFGLNHIRFHSWCPPEAAFNAADKSGFYLSVECSAWATVGDGAGIDQYIYDESERIVSNFGNHPSFCMMSYGNEASGKNSINYLTGFVNYWKAKDNRRLYTSASGFPISPASDYVSSPNPRIQWWGAGLKSPINSFPPTTDFDWAQLIEPDKPTVGHEIGQWCVYPNFKEMSKYMGVLKPKNFEIFQEFLQENHLEHLADSFLMASGKLQVLCYKAEIEAALRTIDFAGFQLLDLHDFPGQGSAFVGVLDPFWDEKPYINSTDYRQFCDTTVLLARIKKMIYTNNEDLIFIPEIAHYGEFPLIQKNIVWELVQQDSMVIEKGKIPFNKIPIGLTSFPAVKIKLVSIKVPEKLILKLSVEGKKNSWDLWVYPVDHSNESDFSSIKICSDFDINAIKYLEKGGTVLLTIKKGCVKPEMGGNVVTGFSSIFWNTSWTNKQAPYTLGILCNPKHPALREFPTEYHSNWQWWDAMSHSNVIITDSLSKEITPIVRVIDDWFTAQSLALIFECRIGKGKLLVSGVDLSSELDKRIEAKQLLYSLKKYMISDEFNPQIIISADKISNLFYSKK